MLRMVFLAAAIGALPCAGIAGDAADREIIGFSPDGSTFAFEEYGVEDGSGFPYSNIYLIETDTDQWVTGTPIRVRLEDDDDATLEQARTQARTEAQAFLDERQIEPGYNLLASNPMTEVSADPHEVRFVTMPHLVPSGSSWTVSLTEKELPAPDCPDDLGGPFQGFALALTDPDGNTRTLTEDSAIPSSRRCPMNYAISDVVSVHPGGAEPVLVILVNVFALGFEGPNRRFLAVTTRFSG